MNILGVRIDPLTRKEAQGRVNQFLRESRAHIIFSPNPEILVDAYRWPLFRNVLNQSALNICDGRGIQLLAKEKVERIPGVDFMLDICALAAEEGSGVYLLGSGSEETVQLTAKNLQEQFPGLNIVGTHQGPKIYIPNSKFQIQSWQVDKHENEDILQNINKTSPRILFVAFGHGKQELWIDQFISQLPSVRVSMGVGGAFDYIAGTIHRAPRLWQKIGVEWLWRLLREPWRLKRMWKAVIIFPYLVFRKNWNKKIIYYMVKFFENPFRQEPLPENADERIITEKFLRSYKPDAIERERDQYAAEIKLASDQVDASKVEYPEQTTYTKQLRDLAMKSHITATEVSDYLSALYKMQACLKRHEILEFTSDKELQKRIRNLDIDILSANSARDVAHMLRNLLRHLMADRDKQAAEDIQMIEAQVKTEASQLRQQETNQTAAGGLSIVATDQNAEGGLSISKPESNGGLSLTASEEEKE